GGASVLPDILRKYMEPLGYIPRFSKNFGGRVVVDALNAEDKEALTQFYRKYKNQELTSWDRTSPTSASAFGATLESALAEKI
ncbi:hypothetical protein VU10_00060, partial [Desulfobulbus sp. US1]|nr:hypothetical protein [Desulfobulbus sp. US1]